MAKKQLILNTALKLFSEQGFHSTSTSKLAKEAGVSEGLIFRHFENKEGLLKAIMEMGKLKAAEIFQSLEAHDNPKDKLKEFLLLPFKLKKAEHPFWRLLYALKWQKEVYDAEMSTEMETLLTSLFIALNYSNPKAEAKTAMILFDGMATAILLKGQNELSEVEHCILSKYNLT